jgi:DNA repair protein SbcD/Mre11
LSLTREEMGSQREIRILLCADTHLGFDEPIRPRVARRHRGADFFANFQRVLDQARDRRVDLVIHGGDLFFRSRVPGAILDRVYRMLLGLAALDIPIVILPGNHERSVLPSSLFLSHRNIHVFTQPETKVFDFAGLKIALAGFPCARDEVRLRFRSLVAQTALAGTEADARFLCLHQTVEGAQVGPSDYTFRGGNDVIRTADLPLEADAVLAGHIHRRQILIHRRPDGTAMPIVYPGSIERTSFAERFEPKGYFELTVGGPGSDGRRRLKFEFVPLPARPMEDILLGRELDRSGLRGFLKSRLAGLDPDSVVRLGCEEGLPSEVRVAVTAELLREVCPATMSIQLGTGFFGPRKPEAG